MPPKPTIVVVDTNCFIRLLFSPLRPILGSTFCGYKLVTLVELKNEVGPGTEVAERNPWLLDEAVQKELDDNCLAVREPKKTNIREQAKHFRSEGNALLRKLCAAKGLNQVRELSSADAKALATAQVLDAALATDEWPLAHVATEASDVQEVLTSLSLVGLIERDGKISRSERIDLVASWVKSGEKLPQDWAAKYRQLFGEEPPDGQS
jgi:rRNA maturation endonuclease Nob1